MNFAVPDVTSSTFLSSEPRPFLSILITEISSVMVIESPLSDLTTFCAPVVAASTLVTLSPLTLKVNADTTV